jgi:elongation factor G
VADDSSLAVKTSDDGTTMIGAASEDQLDTAVNQLVHRFGVDATIRNIEIAYKETVTRAAEGESKYAMHSDGHGRYAHVKVRVEPGGTGSGCVFENTILGTAIPGEMLVAVTEAILEVIAKGVCAGYPIDDVRVTVCDGSYHTIDSSHAAFRTVGRLAFVEAVRRAKPVLLEPIMSLSVVAPLEYQRRVIDGLRARGAASFQVSGTKIAGAGMITISTYAPLSQMFGYARDLGARTDRLGTFTMTFSHYAPAIMSEDDGDRAADVTAPLRPRTPPLILRASVPEPRQ